MIRAGRSQGWLSLPRSDIIPWAAEVGVQFNGVRLAALPGHEERGFAVVATRDIPTDHDEPLIIVPRDLILSQGRCHRFAVTDGVLRSIYEDIDNFARTTRGAILVFLLYQITLANPSVRNASETALQSPYIRYVKGLPVESLPTLWSKEERELLTGTTLRPAVEAKLRSLMKEYNDLRQATLQNSWCRDNWWSDREDRGLAFSDWLQVDAMYRSRALEYPGIGDAMAPCIDMANHAANEDTMALYELEESDSSSSSGSKEFTDGSNGNSVLVMRDSKSVNAGEEITITYGDGKGACEMLFSYGFIDDGMRSAKELFLNLSMQDDDPLAQAKMHLANTAPGVRIFECANESVDWESPYVWLICVNQEDGFDLRTVSETAGLPTLQAYWKGERLPDVDHIEELIRNSSMWDVFQLRAAALISGRVDAQIQQLQETQAMDVTPSSPDGIVRTQTRQLANNLRQLEYDLLAKMSTHLSVQCERLMSSEVVQNYLGASSSSSSG